MRQHLVPLLAILFLVVVGMIATLHGGLPAASSLPSLPSWSSSSSEVVGRFQLAQVGDGLVVRLDTRTGLMKAYVVVPSRDGQGTFREVAKSNFFDTE
jgi:hypothetical protein